MVQAEKVSGLTQLLESQGAVLNDDSMTTGAIEITGMELLHQQAQHGVDECNNIITNDDDDLSEHMLLFLNGIEIDDDSDSEKCDSYANDSLDKIRRNDDIGRRRGGRSRQEETTRSNRFRNRRNSNESNYANDSVELVKRSKNQKCANSGTKTKNDDDCKDVIELKLNDVVVKDMTVPLAPKPPTIGTDLSQLKPVRISNSAA